MQTVAVLGNLSLDRIDGGELRPGGGPFHAARALRALNRPAFVVAACAEADRAKLLRPLIGLGVPVLWRESASTARFSIRYEGEERILIAEELGEPWRPQDLPEKALAPVTWLHVAPLAGSDFPPETLEALARGGRRRVSFDGQGLVRPVHPGLVELASHFDPELLRHVSILKLAEEEARVLVGEPTEQALRGLGVPEVVVTLGSRGSIVFADGLAEHVPTNPLTGPDPTGAGDAFAAVYLVARAGGLTPPASARYSSGVVGGLLSGHVT